MLQCVCVCVYHKDWCRGKGNVRNCPQGRLLCHNPLSFSLLLGFWAHTCPVWFFFKWNFWYGAYVLIGETERHRKKMKSKSLGRYSYATIPSPFSSWGFGYTHMCAWYEGLLKNLFIAHLHTVHHYSIGKWVFPSRIHCILAQSRILPYMLSCYYHRIIFHFLFLVCLPSFLALGSFPLTLCHFSPSFHTVSGIYSCFPCPFFTFIDSQRY